MMPGRVNNPRRMPPGKTDMWPGDTPPAGALVRDGAEYSESAYARLFAVIGTKYNTGGETPGYFRVPNDEDEFIRGASASRGVGTTEVDQFGNHRHVYGLEYQANAGPDTVYGADSAGGGGSGVTNFEGGDQTQPMCRVYLPIIWY